MQINNFNQCKAAEQGCSGPTIFAEIGRATASRRAALLISLVIATAPQFSNALETDINTQSDFVSSYDYDADIAPILEQYCVKCHGPEKQKSRYRLDDYERLLTPGSSDLDPIVPGKPLDSILVENLLFPLDDEYHMPPEDEDQPSSAETLKIVQWVLQGAISKKAQIAKLPLEDTLNEEELAALQLLRESGALIHKRGNSHPALFADLQQVQSPLPPKTLKALKSLGPKVEVLQLVGLKHSKAVLNDPLSFENLIHLDLRTSDADDGIISAINKLEFLQHLNLFGTQVSDTGIAKLKAPALKTLYVGRTKVTSAGMEKFMSDHSATTVIGDVDLRTVEKITELAQNNSTTFFPEKEKKVASKVPAIPAGVQVSNSGIRHSFLVCGRTTAIFNENSEVVWSTPGNARDGMVLENGNVLLSIGGEAKEFLKGTQEVVWSYKLDPRNKELGTANRLPNGNTLVVERGILPRLLEVNRAGKIVVEVPLQPETDNNHMQTRMARKLPNGNYLVPHLLAFKVKEYTPKGKVVNVIATDLLELGGREAENWPFTAIRMPNGNTVVNLTHGNKTVEFSPDGSVAWMCNNNEVNDRFQDPCGGQRLPNGNTVIGSYAQKDPDKVKIFEVNQSKEVVWEFFHPTVKAHEVHILTTNGKPVKPIYR